MKAQEIASSAAVPQNGVESKSQSKKRKRLLKENGRFKGCTMVLPWRLQLQIECN